MSGSSQAGLAEKYLVDDLPGAALVGARLNGILQKIEAGETLTSLAQAFLTSGGLNSLLALATGQIDRPTFEEAAARERSDRIQRAKEDADRVTAEQTQKAEAMDAAIKARFAAMDNDPVLRKRREARELWDRFDIGFIETEHYPRAMRLLKQVASGDRLAPEDVAWLSTEVVDCWTDALQKAWHRLEAEALTKAWEESRDPWDAVNASAHWRKADEPQQALEVTEAALAKAGRNPKPRSALLTTRGGAMRDAGRLTEARTIGLEAHELIPADFRPCTLLGAVSMGLGDLAAGHEWYAKAEALGGRAPRHRPGSAGTADPFGTRCARSYPELSARAGSRAFCVAAKLEPQDRCGASAITGAGAISLLDRRSSGEGHSLSRTPGPAARPTAGTPRSTGRKC